MSELLGSNGYDVNDAITPKWAKGELIKHEEVRKVIHDLYEALAKFQPTSRGSSMSIADMDEKLKIPDETGQPVPPANLWEEIQQLRWRLSLLFPGPTKWWEEKRGASVFGPGNGVLDEQNSTIPRENPEKIYRVLSLVETITIPSKTSKDAYMFDSPEFILLLPFSSTAKMVTIVKYGNEVLGTITGPAMIFFSKTGQEEKMDLVSLGPPPVYEKATEMITLEEEETIPITKFGPGYVFFFANGNLHSYKCTFSGEVAYNLRNLPYTIKVFGGRHDKTTLTINYPLINKEFSCEEQGTYFFYGGHLLTRIPWDIAAYQAKKGWLSRNEAQVFTQASLLYPIIDGDSIGDEETHSPFDVPKLVWLLKNPNEQAATIKWWRNDTSECQDLVLTTDYTVVIGGPNGAEIVWQYDMPAQGFLTYEEIEPGATTNIRSSFYSVDTSATLSDDDIDLPFVVKQVAVDVYNRGTVDCSFKVRLKDKSLGEVILPIGWRKVLLTPDIAPEIVAVAGSGGGGAVWSVRAEVDVRTDAANRIIARQLNIKGAGSDDEIPITLDWPSEYFNVSREMQFKIADNYGLIRVKITIKDELRDALNFYIFNDAEMWEIFRDPQTSQLVALPRDLGSPRSGSVKITRFSTKVTQCPFAADEYEISAEEGSQSRHVSLLRYQYDARTLGGLCAAPGGRAVKFFVPKAADLPVKIDAGSHTGYFDLYTQSEVWSIPHNDHPGAAPYRIYYYDPSHNIMSAESHFVSVPYEGPVTAERIYLYDERALDVRPRIAELEWPAGFFDLPRTITFECFANIRRQWPDFVHVTDYAFFFVHMYERGRKEKGVWVNVWNPGEQWRISKSGTALQSELVFAGRPRSTIVELKNETITARLGLTYKISYEGTGKCLLVRQNLPIGSIESVSRPIMARQTVLNFYAPNIGTGSRSVRYIINGETGVPVEKVITLRSEHETWMFAPDCEAICLLQGK